MAANTARPIRFDGADGHSYIIWAAIQELKAKQYSYVRPMELARTIGCTRAEANLVLRYLGEVGMAKRRDGDGRWYYTDPMHGGPVRA